MTSLLLVGPLGAGKTSHAKWFAETIPSGIYVSEPVEKNPFFLSYVQDHQRWGFTCQTYYYLQYVLEYQRKKQTAASESVFVIDAGAQTNKYIYGRYMQEQHIVTEDEFHFYETMTELIDYRYQYPIPTVCISIEASFDECYRRLTTRDQDIEATYHSKEYLQMIFDYTKDMVLYFEHEGLPLIHINTEDVSLFTDRGKETLHTLIMPFLQPS